MLAASPPFLICPKPLLPHVEMQTLDLLMQVMQSGCDQSSPVAQKGIRFFVTSACQCYRRRINAGAIALGARTEPVGFLRHPGLHSQICTDSDTFG